MLLLGIPYYHIHKRERGYESTGSFWGLLWEYETESETNFTKFSLLKLLYKRVDMNGEVGAKAAKEAECKGVIPAESTAAFRFLYRRFHYCSDDQHIFLPLICVNSAICIFFTEREG